MSYTLVLHIVALGLGGLGVICGLLDLIPGFSMICFPTFFASICGGVALIALIFDLIMFYMYRAAVNRVSGAQGNVGMAVWMTLAAWLCACFAGCAYGMGRCCCSCGGYGADNKRSWRRDRKRDNDRDRELDAYHRRDEDMRLEALRDENRRKAEQTQAERMPLKEPEDDKYLYDDAGDHIPAVGAGYGRRGPQGNQYQYQPNPYDPNHNQGLSQQEYQYDYSSGVEPSVPYQQDSYNRRDYEPSIATAGAAGVGAGPGGIVPAGKGYDGHNQYDYGQPNYATGSYEQGGYDDHNISGYDQQPQHDGYGNSQGYNDPYAHAQAPQPNSEKVYGAYRH
jgi:hypothetical protein